MQPLVRKGHAADTELIAEFNRLLALESEGIALDPVTLVRGVAACLDDPAKGVYFVAEVDGSVVGQLGVTTEWSDWRNGWMWWIQSVYVRPENRKQGVFRALYEHVLKQARLDPLVIGLRLYVEHENHNAQATYARLGMARTGYLVLERCPL